MHLFQNQAQKGWVTAISFEKIFTKSYLCTFTSVNAWIVGLGCHLTPWKYSSCFTGTGGVQRFYWMGMADMISMLACTLQGTRNLVASQHRWDNGEAAGAFVLPLHLYSSLRPPNCPVQVEGCSFRISPWVWKWSPKCLLLLFWWYAIL